MGKFSPKVQDCLFKGKFGIQIDSGMRNSMMMFIFSVYDEMPFLKKLVPNYHSYKFLFKLFNLIMSSFCFDKNNSGCLLYFCPNAE